MVGWGVTLEIQVLCSLEDSKDERTNKILVSQETKSCAVERRKDFSQIV